MPYKKTPLTRRDFLKGTVGTTIGASVIGPGFLKAGRIAPKSELCASRMGFAPTSRN